MKCVLSAIAAASLSLVHTGAGAQAQQQQPAQQQAPTAGDPNEVVCEKQTVIGSRLAKRRICKTRAEWAVQRQADRMDVEKTQIQRGSCEGCQ